MKQYYQMKSQEAINLLHSDDLQGLSSVEASTRLERYGDNVLKQKNKKSPLKIFLGQFANIMILLLILVGIVSLVYSIVNQESIIESIVIFSCVIVNAVMGFVQEMKSENAVESLKTITASKVQVKRDGLWKEIDAKELVVGDIISLDAGDKVPADARIISSVGLKVDESLLTGESLSVEKSESELVGDKLIQEQTNILFSGTSVVNGRAEAVVIYTGIPK